MEIQVMKNILDGNEKIAEENEKIFAEKKVFVLNLMGSPGAGKTSLLEKTMEKLKDKLNMAVIEGDLFTDKDAARIQEYGVKVTQINTAGGCHLDAAMVEKAAKNMDLENLDLLIVENVGNLVCPAEFRVGEDERAVVLSITEGDDKPLKYPLIFKESAITILNKVDLLEFCNFSVESAKSDITALNPTAKIVEVSCTKNIGIDDWCDWICQKVKEKRGE